MVIYLAGFSLSVTLLYVRKYIKKSQRKYIALIALLIPCIIAALRADSIGTDTYGYLVKLVDFAKDSDSLKEYLSKSWFDVWRDKRVSDFEIGFSVSVYYISSIFGGIGPVEFFIQAMIIFPLYSALKRLGKNEVVWLCFLIYYFIFFNVSLNMMRQSIAMSFVLLSFANMVNSKNRRAITAEIIAILFHTSAIIGIFIILIYKYINNNEAGGRLRKLGKNAKIYFLIFAGIIVISGTEFIIILLNYFGLSRYTGYINGKVFIMPNQIISRAPLFIGYLFLWKQLKNREPLYLFLFIMSVYDLFCSQLYSIMEFSGRVGYYFSQFNIISISSFYTSTKKNKILLIPIIGYLLIYWFFYFVYGNSGNTVPYLFR